jgi:AcrR family transcriptional regulator
MQEAGLRGTLIQAASALLEHEGTEISLRAVARAAGVSAMAPYRHFADKAALLGALADDGFAELRDRLRAADDAATPVTALIAQGMAYIDMALDHPALFRLMFADARTAARTADCDAPAYRVLAERVATIMGDGQPHAATVAWGIVHGLAMLSLDGRLPPDRAERERVLTLFAHGLCRDGASPPLSPSRRGLGMEGG